MTSTTIQPIPEPLPMSPRSELGPNYAGGLRMNGEEIMELILATQVKQAPEAQIEKKKEHRS
jgi:hypothetical protein